MKRTKIVCTIGPASKDVDKIKELILAGMNVARLNFSHGGYKELKPYIEAVKKAREELDLPVAMLLDTQGPEIRIKEFENGKIILHEGKEFVLTTDDIIGNELKVSVTYKKLSKDVKVGNKILIDDGKIELEVIKIKKNDIICRVLNGGEISNKKSVNVPGVHINLPALSEKDKQDLETACMCDFDYIAASFVRSAEDVKNIRKILKNNNCEDIKIIAKIESQEGIDNFDSILEQADGIMVARGDLGVEIPMEEVPIIQKSFIKKCNAAAKIVITATQMLESMTNNPRPTRAEISDVANAIYDISGAIMLSGETALGKYSTECVKLMSKIAESTEKSINYDKRVEKKELENLEYEFYLNSAICTIAKQMNVKAIFAYTEGGDTPRMISAFMPICPIFAITKYEKTYRQLALVNNVFPVLIKGTKDPKTMISKGIETIKFKGLVNEGDIVAIAGGDTILAREKDKMNRTIGGVIKV